MSCHFRFVRFATVAIGGLLTLASVGCQTSGISSHRVQSMVPQWGHAAIYDMPRTIDSPKTRPTVTDVDMPLASLHN